MHTTFHGGRLIPSRVPACISRRLNYLRCIMRRPSYLRAIRVTLYRGGILIAPLLALPTNSIASTRATRGWTFTRGARRLCAVDRPTLTQNLESASSILYSMQILFAFRICGTVTYIICKLPLEVSKFLSAATRLSAGSVLSPCANA